MRQTLIAIAMILSISQLKAGEYVAPGHHEHHDWYFQIQQELGIDGCCDDRNNDCGPVSNYVDLGPGYGAKVFLEDGKWYDTESPQKKYYVDTPDGRAHVCRRPATNDFGKSVGGFHFYCIFLPRPIGFINPYNWRVATLNTGLP